jgi:hypothetical protein
MAGGGGGEWRSGWHGSRWIQGQLVCPTAQWWSREVVRGGHQVLEEGGRTGTEESALW